MCFRPSKSAAGYRKAPFEAVFDQTMHGDNAIDMLIPPLRSAIAKRFQSTGHCAKHPPAEYICTICLSI